MEFVIILLLLIVNGIFAMYEIALVSSRKSTLEVMAKNGKKSALKVLKQQDDSEQYLSTIQIGITLIGIVSGAFAGVTIADDLQPLFAMIPGIGAYAKDLSMIMVLIVITYLSIVVGELVPKTIGLNNPEKFSTMFAPMMSVLNKIMYPFVKILSISTKVITRLIGLKKVEDRFLTEDELKYEVKKSMQQQEFELEIADMIFDVFRFGYKTAENLMTHRMDVITLNVNNTKEEVLKVISEKHFNRYLLMGTDREKIEGVVSVIDILKLVSSDEQFNLKSIAREPLYIAENTDGKKIMGMFRNNKKKFGVVVDEYGDFIGIITHNDLTSIVYGTVFEGNQKGEEMITERVDGAFEVNGKMNIDDFCAKLGIIQYKELKKKGITTVSGLVMLLNGGIVHKGDILRYQNLSLSVTEAEKSRAKQLLVIKCND